MRIKSMCEEVPQNSYHNKTFIIPQRCWIVHSTVGFWARGLSLKKLFEEIEPGLFLKAIFKSF